MARDVLRTAVLAIAVAMLCGCAGSRPMLAVLRGNLAYGRGDYQTALVHYLSAGDETADRGWLLFNQANVYYALGEQEAALATWDEARSSTSTAVGRDAEAPLTLLIHAASYNRGVLLYQRGDYEAAYDEFRYALDVNPQSVPTKVNLELALRKIRSAEQAEQVGGDAGSVSDKPTDEEAGPATLRILEYVRRKEAQRWFANKETDDPPDPRDW